ncbi:MAG: hypothetical protein HKN10_17405 [Myxococcales bacterium]|nr:hypothetical protein [Myxococcales bacterium]
MTRKRYSQLPILAAALLCAFVQIGCQKSEQPYSITGGYTFSQDFDMERRVLRIEPSSERLAACITTRLPSETSPAWKRTLLAPAMHRALLDLLFDETRLPSYQADLDAVEQSGTFVCSPRPKPPEFCYRPEVVVTGDVPKVFVKVARASDPRLGRSPMRFGLQEQVALSKEGRELIDAFLEAHQACWNPDG